MLDEQPQQQPQVSKKDDTEEEEEVANIEKPVGQNNGSGDYLEENNVKQTTDDKFSQKEAEDEGEDEVYPPLLECMVGMQDDLRARLPYYKDDWRRPRSLGKVINATIFAFLVQLIPALIFADLLEKETDGQLATAETLLSTGIIGIMFAIMAGQGLVLLGVTGPAALLLGRSSGLAETFNAEYFPFFFWVCFWAAIMHCVTAMSGIVNFVFRMTPFTSEIFEFFIAISFMYEAMKSLLVPLELGSQQQKDVNPAAGYATLVLAVMTFFICIQLHFAESSWTYFTHAVRTFLTSYGIAIAVVVVTALSYLPGIDSIGIPRVNLQAPWDWQPTADRPWVVHPLEGVDASGIIGALLPAFLLYLLFYVDHNVGSILTQDQKYHLTKPPAYHWDFFVLGLTIVVCGVVGVPPGNGLIPQAPLHTRALSTRKLETKNGIQVETVTFVEEQRWSALGQAVLMFLALSLFVVLSWIPQGVLFGVFFHLGFTALWGNGVWNRISLSLVDQDCRPKIPIVTKVSSWRQVQLYTLLQVACALASFCVAQFTPVSYIFPALIMALVPVRIFVVPRFFSKADLVHLDPAHESAEEKLEEKRAEHDAKMERDSIIVMDMALSSGRTSFRVSEETPGPAGMRRASVAALKRRSTAGKNKLEGLNEQDLLETQQSTSTTRRHTYNG